MKQSERRGLWVLAVVLWTSGCANVHLYSETRDKQGQAATKAWDEVDLKGFFAAERENRAKVLEQEILTSQRRITADRDVEAALLAKSPVDKLVCRYERRLTALATKATPAPATTPDPAQDVASLLQDPCANRLAPATVSAITDATLKARSALRSVDRFSGNLERERSFWRQQGIPVFSCDDLLHSGIQSPPPAGAPAAASAAAGAQIDGRVGIWLAQEGDAARPHVSKLRSAARTCGEIAKARSDYQTAITAFPGGSLEKRVKDLAAALDALDAEQKALSTAQGRYAQALAQYKKELAAQQQGQSTQDKVKDAATKLQQAIDAFETLPGFLKDKFVSEERIERIDDALAAIKEGKAPGDDASKLQTSIYFLPMLADDLRAVRTAGKGSNAVPLLIKRDVEQARLNAAKTVVASREHGIELQRAAIESALAEVRSVIDARTQFLQPPDGDPAPLGLDQIKEPLSSAWDPLTRRQRYALLQSVSLYLDAVGRQRALTERLDRTRLALASEEASALSEVNAGMWTALIGATVAQTADYSATGLKAADFEGILSTLGILWIGHGTNK